jgi:hypothetical protein
LESARLKVHTFEAYPGQVWLSISAASAEDPSPAGSEGWGQRMVGHDLVGAEPTGHRKCTASLAWARYITAPSSSHPRVGADDP